MVRDDLTIEQTHYFAAEGRLAWDIETSGLDWSKESIGTCQLAGRSRSVIVQLDGRRPDRLSSLLEDSDVTKIFHHAMFDLRFMSHAWGVAPANIVCTKVASKILQPGVTADAHSLKALLEAKLDVRLSKEQQTSDWLRDRLSAEQIEYAVRDVAYLAPLLSVLLRELEAAGKLHLALASFAYIPTRVWLDLSGTGDVFTY